MGPNQLITVGPKQLVIPTDGASWDPQILARILNGSGVRRCGGVGWMRMADVVVGCDSAFVVPHRARGFHSPGCRAPSRREVGEFAGGEPGPRQLHPVVVPFRQRAFPAKELLPRGDVSSKGHDRSVKARFGSNPSRGQLP